MSPQVHHLRATHVSGVCRCVKLTSLRSASEDFGNPNFRQLFRAQIEEVWGHEASGLVLGYDQNVLLDSIFIKPPHGCRSTINHFTALHLLSIWDLIAR